MAIPTTTNDDIDEADDEEIKYMNRVMETWVVWSFSIGNLSIVSFGDLVGLTTKKRTRLLNLTDDQLLLVDRRITQLPSRMKRLVDLEYFESGTAEQKGRRIGVDRKTYAERIDGVLSALYGELRPDIDAWRDAVL